MKALRERTGVAFGFGFWEKRTPLLLIFAVAFIVNIYPLNGASGIQLTRCQLKATVSRDSLTSNSTEAALTVNFHFENRTPSEEEICRNSNETRSAILRQLNRTKKTTTTNKPTTVAVDYENTDPVIINPYSRKKRKADDFNDAVGETIVVRQKRDDANEYEYVEEDLPFINIAQCLKDGVLRVPIFIKNDKGPDSEPGDWVSVGNRLFKATAAVKEELQEMAGVSNVTITRGVPVEQPMVSACLAFWIGILLGAGVICLVVLYCWKEQGSPRKKIPFTTKDDYKIQDPMKMSHMGVSNGHVPASVLQHQYPRVIDDNCGWLVPMDHLSDDHV